MATKIKIKRSTSAVPNTLEQGELAYSGLNDVFYIGAPSDGTVTAIGGKRNPGTLTANQALVANATSGIDKVIVANLVPQTLYANNGLGSAGYVLVTPGDGSNVYWASASAVGGVNADAQYTFSNTVTFNKDLIANTVNTASWSSNTSQFTLASGTKLAANGSTGSVGQVLMTDASGVAYWSSETGDISAVTAGDGLSGGGSSGDVTVSVLANNGITANSTGVWAKGANGIVVDAGGINVKANNGIVANSTGTWVKAANGISVTSDGVNALAGNNQLVSNSSGIWVDQSNIDHNSLANYDANKHVDHTSVSISTGDGLTGGGDISATRTLSVVANNGIVANSTGVWAKAANGISVDASGINVAVGNGLVSNASGVYLQTGSTLTVNSGGLHVNNNLSITDLTLAGNLTINGTLTTVDTTNLTVNDSIIELARNNSADSLDIGFFGKYDDGTARYTGLVWDTSADVYELFSNTTVAPTTTLNTSGTGYTRAILKSYLDTGALIANSTVVNITANSSVAVSITANSLTLDTALAATDGGTGFDTYAVGDLLVGTSGNALLKLAVNATDGKILQSNGTTVVYGDVDGGTF